MSYREEATGASFVLGVMAGAVIGAGVALLFAPKTGEETRRVLGEQYRGLAERVSEATDTLRTQGRERANQFASQLSDRISSAADRLSSTTDRLSSTPNTPTAPTTGIGSSAPSV